MDLIFCLKVSFKNLVLDLGGYDLLVVTFEMNYARNSMRRGRKSNNKIVVGFVLF